MKTLLTTATGVALPLSFQPLYAQDAGFYVGGSLGQVEFNCAGVAIIACDGKDTSWRVVGGYQFKRRFAAELGYADLGRQKVRGLVTVTGGSEDITIDTEVSAWDLSALGSFPLTDKLFAYGRAGLYRAEVENRGTVTSTGSRSGVGSFDKTSAGSILGVGLKYELLRSLAVRAEWHRYFGVDGVLGSDVDVMSVGLLYRF